MTSPHPVPAARGRSTPPPAVPAPRATLATPTPPATGGSPQRRSDPAEEPAPLRLDPRRWLVVDRLALVGQRHAIHLRHRHTTPATRPARHAVVFVFHQPRRGTDDGLRIAQRLFLDGDDVSDLTSILTALADRVSDYRRARHSPLARVIGRHEPIARQARYLATVTSSVGPVAPDGDPSAPRPWRGLAHLLDGTQLAIRARIDPTALVPDTAALDNATTHTLAVHTPLEPFGRQRPWHYLTLDPANPGRTDVESAEADRAETDRAELAGALAALHRLHALITDSEHRFHHRQRTP